MVSSKKRSLTEKIIDNDSCKKPKTDDNISGEENNSNNNHNSNDDSNKIVLECETDEEKLLREAKDLKQINQYCSKIMELNERKKEGNFRL